MLTNFDIDFHSKEPIEGLSLKESVVKIPLDNIARNLSTVGLRNVKIPGFKEALDSYHYQMTFRASNLGTKEENNLAVAPVKVELDWDIEHNPFKTIDQIIDNWKSKFEGNNAPEYYYKEGEDLKRVYPNLKLQHDRIKIIWFCQATGEGDFIECDNLDFDDYRIELNDDLYRLLGFDDSQVYRDTEISQLPLLKFGGRNDETDFPNYYSLANSLNRIQHGLSSIYMIIKSPQCQFHETMKFSEAILNKFAVLKKLKVPLKIGDFSELEINTDFGFQPLVFIDDKTDGKVLEIAFIGYSGINYGFQYLDFKSDDLSFALTFQS